MTTGIITFLFPVTLHDIVHTDKSLTLVFEYLERDLKQYMDDCGAILSMNNVKLFLFQVKYSFNQIVSFSTEMFQCFPFLVNILTSGKFMGYSNETGKFGLPNFQNNANLPSSVQTWTIKS